MYTIENIHEKLLQLELLSRNALLDGGYEATTVNLRNTSLIVVSRKSEHYFIKQAEFASEDIYCTLQNEIFFYERVGECLPELADCIPEPVHGDAHESLLILKYHAASTTFWNRHKREAANGLPFTTLILVGNFLARLHKTLSAIHLRSLSEFEFLGSTLPGAFRLLKPHPNILQQATPGALHFIERLQAQNGIDDHWQNVANLWETNAIVHGNVKLDNLILDEHGGAAEEEAIKVADWNAVQYGDTAWDVAGVLSDIIYQWCVTMANDNPSADIAKHAKSALAQIGQGANAFLDAYKAMSHIEGRALERQFFKAIAFTGIKIIQTSFELTSDANSMPSLATLLYHIGIDIIENPQQARDQLRGITQHVSRTAEIDEALNGA
ncbi:MAG TPA: phosphotransferase [Burkholderiaceae bacterium]